MHIRKLPIVLALATTFALGTAVAQESDDSAATDSGVTDQQRPDRERIRNRRENMTEEERAAMRERWEGMSDEERQAARDKMRSHRGGKDGQRGHRQHRGDHKKGDRPTKPANDEA